MSRFSLPSSIVSVQWLSDHIDQVNLIVLDATIPKVGQTMESIADRPIIPGARYMDLKKDFSTQDAPFPNTIPTPEQFEASACKLGVNQDSIIVVYDMHGIYCAPRAYWLFRAMGHKNVAVLDGGLPAWLDKKLDTVESFAVSEVEGDFRSVYNTKYFTDYKEVLKAIEDETVQIIDARSAGRFRAEVPEPRKGLRGGHIPRSSNIPIASLMQDGVMKSPEEIKYIFSQAKAKGKESIIYSCGSGITACVLAWAAESVGYTGNRVFDGSWTEWGSIEELPVEK